MRALIEAAKPGISVLSLCEKGDAFITAETSKVFKKEKEIKKGNGGRIPGLLSILVHKFNILQNNFKSNIVTCQTGIAFPTCVSVNNCVCHFSPLKSDPDYTLQDGDLVKM